MVTFVKPDPAAPPAVKILSKNIPDGTAFTGRIGGYSARYFLKVRGVIHALDCEKSDNPFDGGMCWDSTHCPVDDFRKIELEIHVKRTQES